MGEQKGLTRRQFMDWGATSLAAASASSFLLGCGESALRPPQAAEAPRGVSYFAKFGVDDALLRAGLAAALSRGGDRADLFFQHRVSSGMTLEDGEVNRAYSRVELGVGIRVLKGDQTGYAFTEDLTRESIERAAKTAASIADGPAREKPIELYAGTELPRRYSIELPWDQVTPGQKLPLLEGVNRSAMQMDARIKKVTIQQHDEAGAVLIADSDGRVVEDIQPMTLLYVTCVAEQNGRREMNGYNVAGRRGLDYFTPALVARVVREAVSRTTVLFDAVAAPAGEMPVVLAAGSSGILLHEAIGHGMEADFNRKRTSIYADRIGKPIAKPFVNIVDDAAVPFARGAINVDDEGNPAGTTMLVEKGVLATYMHDAISAKHYGVRPTGNGRRQSYQHAPLPRMRATYMLAGPHDQAEIIASVKNGIYCQSFSNGEVQIGAGDFTFYVRNGFLIENGKLTRPIKDINIIGNGPRVLEQIDMVGSDLVIDEGGWTCGKDVQSVPVSQGIPTVRVASMTVGGQAKKG